MTVAAANVEIPAPGEVRRRPYRVAELAERWDIDVSTVYRMIYVGVVHAERHGPRRSAEGAGGCGCRVRASCHRASRGLSCPRRHGGASVSTPIAMSAPAAAWVPGERAGGGLPLPPALIQLAQAMAEGRRELIAELVGHGMTSHQVAARPGSRRTRR